MRELPPLEEDGWEVTAERLDRYPGYWQAIAREKKTGISFVRLGLGEDVARAAVTERANIRRRLGS
jgi:hypothetical protein